MALKPSDYLKTAEDGVGDALATIRRKALRASSQKRKDLEDVYDKLSKRHRKIAFKDTKRIDKDPRIKEATADLQRQSELIQKAQREIATATQAIDKGKRIIGYADKIIDIIIKVV